jgi:hypothetical protein
VTDEPLDGIDLPRTARLGKNDSRDQSTPAGRFDHRFLPGANAAKALFKSRGVKRVAESNWAEIVTQSRSGGAARTYRHTIDP